MEPVRNIVIKDSVFDPQQNSLEKKVSYYKGKGNRILYKVWLYLEGPDVVFVDYVIYTLHPTFSDTQRSVPRSISNQNCALILWTWGLFEVKAKIFLKTGAVVEAFHYLTYDKQLKTPGLNLINTGGAVS